METHMNYIGRAIDKHTLWLVAGFREELHRLCKMHKIHITANIRTYDIDDVVNFRTIDEIWKHI